MWRTPVHVVRPPLRSHVRQVFAADMAEEEASIHQITRLGSPCFSVQLLLQLQGQNLIAVLRATVGAEGLRTT